MTEIHLPRATFAQRAQYLLDKSRTPTFDESLAPAGVELKGWFLAALMLLDDMAGMDGDDDDTD